MDKRDQRGWVAIELTREGESYAEDNTLVDRLRYDLGCEDSHPIFVPCATMYKGDEVVNVHLMEGYCFVACGLSDTAYFRLESTSYVKQVLSTTLPNLWYKIIKVIPNENIRDMQKQLDKLKTKGVTHGDRVKIMNGKYRTMEGKVLDVVGDHADVFFQLRSLQAIVRLPVAFFTVLGSEV